MRTPPSLRVVAAAALNFLFPSAHAAEEGPSNNFFGTDAGANNTGFNNSFFGATAGRENTDGTGNSFFGWAAGESNTTGDENAFFGIAAGRRNTTASRNAFFGTQAGAFNTTGDSNAFFGSSAGLSNTTGSDNAFFGRFAGFNNTVGLANAFFGSNAGISNTSGDFNVFFGTNAGQDNTTGSGNAFFGFLAGLSNTEGRSNSFFGDGVGQANTTGRSNAFFGTFAGRSNTTENNNTFLGSFSEGAAGITNATALGHRAGVTQSNSLVLGSINGINGAGADTNVGIGISAPAAPLHVRRFDGTANLLVEEVGPSGQQRLLTLRHAGAPLFVLEDTAQNTSWTFRTGGAVGQPSEGFVISKIGTGVPEMLVRANGNLQINGTLTELSSREKKSNIKTPTYESVLDKVRRLDVPEWTYNASPEALHIGPIAEDFFSAFGYGTSDKTISPRDIAGVALAAVKALQMKVDVLENDNKALKTQLSKYAEFEYRIAALEALADSDHTTQVSY